MNTFFEIYDVELKTISPVFIGNGQEIRKFEYVHNKYKKELLMLDVPKMYSYLCESNKEKAFENYIQNPRIDLIEWMQMQRISEEKLDDWTRYRLQIKDASIEKGSKLQIMSFVKDAYGLPYIPGSSLKGMLRTILLSYDIHLNKDKYCEVKEAFERINSGVRKSILAKENREIEHLSFNQLDRTKEKYDAVNDIMSGMIISDSEPLKLEDLTLCSKIECFPNGKTKSINILRESIKPETSVKFRLKIDRNIFKYSVKYIEEAISYFATQYYDNFVDKFMADIDTPGNGIVWLGGGVGFTSKTTVYPLFNREAVSIIKNIFDKTGVQSVHNHSRDIKLGVSPHILKVTRYNGRMYQFGMCRINFQPHKVNTVF